MAMAETVSTTPGSGGSSEDIESPGAFYLGDRENLAFYSHDNSPVQEHVYDDDEPRLHSYEDPDIIHYDEPQDDFDVYGQPESHVYEDMSRYGGPSSVMVEICDDSTPGDLPSPPPPPPKRKQQKSKQNQQKSRQQQQSHRVPHRDLEAGGMSRKKKSTRRIRAKAAHLSKSPSVKAKRYNPSLPDPKREPDNSCTARYWKPFTWFCTLLIPDAFICKDGPEAKQAWREKVTIFEIMIIANLIFLFVFGVVPLYFCRENTPLSEFEQYVDPACTGLQYAMFGLLYFVAALMLLQCICSMIVGINSLCLRMERKKKPFTEEDLQAGVMIMVPCYNEGDAELRKTIKSILNTDYPDENKVLVVVADGIITGRGEWINTPRTLANLLGFELSKRDKAYSYKSIGTKTENKASLYHGTYENNGRSLKYIVIVKRGTPEEKESTKPGNRGKRDSQLITLGLFNRVHHDRRLNELDEAICRALNDLQIPAIELEYLLAIDADTRVSESSVSYMVHSMDKNRKVLACCGETKVDNKTESWVTMIQVYEYFASHMLKKAFESVFGCVTCLPGCFTMYRMFDDDWRPLVSADNVFQAYSRNDIDSLHEKNLYHLGEDRMLTTLLLRYFSEMRLNYVPVASCWTIVPSSFQVLLSQRRRWINSTFHNMWELLKVKTMCGICCLSMNSIVVLDMISTMILPASVIYAGVFIYAAVVDGLDLTLSTIILYGVLLGTQVVIFLVRSRIDYIFWFLIYIFLGLPVFYFLLPLYSFWHMDDLSWGSTRQVTEKKPSSPSKKSQPKTSSSKPVEAAAPPRASSKPRASSIPKTTNAARTSQAKRSSKPQRQSAAAAPAGHPPTHMFIDV